MRDPPVGYAATHARKKLKHMMSRQFTSFEPFFPPLPLHSSIITSLEFTKKIIIITSLDMIKKTCILKLLLLYYFYKIKNEDI